MRKISTFSGHLTSLPFKRKCILRIQVKRIKGKKFIFTTQWPVQWKAWGLFDFLLFYDTMNMYITTVMSIYTLQLISHLFPFSTGKNPPLTLFKQPRCVCLCWCVFDEKWKKWLSFWFHDQSLSIDCFCLWTYGRRYEVWSQSSGFVVLGMYSGIYNKFGYR